MTDESWVGDLNDSSVRLVGLGIIFMGERVLYVP